MSFYSSIEDIFQDEVTRLFDSYATDLYNVLTEKYGESKDLEELLEKTQQEFLKKTFLSSRQKDPSSKDSPSVPSVIREASTSSVCSNLASMGMLPSPSGKSVSAPDSPSRVGKCTSLLKTGVNKGKYCEYKAEENGLCKRHRPKVVGAGGICSFIIKTGARKNEECGAKTQPGDLYCSKHKATNCVFDLAGKKCGKTLSIHSPSGQYCRVHLIDELEIDTSKFFKPKVPNKFGNLVHEKTGFVFEKVENELLVSKKQLSNGSFAPLDEEDYECIIAYKFPSSFLPKEIISKVKEYQQRKL
jgi:hypothetical protein